jgi:hypothetical protein
LSAKVFKEIVAPLTTSGRANGGATVPKGNMVDGVAAIPHVYHSMYGISKRHTHLAYRFLRVAVQQIQCEGARSGSRSSKAARYWEEGGKRWIAPAKREDEYSLVSDTFTQKESATVQSFPY